jgi:hypothetical protein
MRFAAGAREELFSQRHKKNKLAHFCGLHNRKNFLGACRFGELQPVVPWIAGIKPPDALQDLVPSALDSRFLKHGEQGLNVANRKCGMRLGGSLKRLLDSDMELTRSNFEPAPATRPQGRGFFHFHQSKQGTKKFPRFGLTTFGGRYLHMIDVGYEHILAMPFLSSSTQ